MGRKKITNLFPDYIRTGKADLEVLSQLVLSAKGVRGKHIDDFPYYQYEEHNRLF